MKAIDRHGRKLYGLFQSAPHTYQKAPKFADVYYDVKTDEVWVEIRQHNEPAELDDSDVIHVLRTHRRTTMQQIADLIDEKLKAANR